MKSNTGKKATSRQAAANAKVEVAGSGGAPELVDMAEAIALLRTSRPTFYRWVRSGETPGDEGRAPMAVSAD